VIPLTAIIPTAGRAATLEKTILIVLACSPPPSEILVYANGPETANAIEVCSRFPNVRALSTPESIGPGGARNALLREARTPWVASFDDDSYPIDQDFFARAAQVTTSLATDVVVVACALFEKDAPPAPPSPPAPGLLPCLDFANGACLWRREAFLKTTGYVPLREAWCMEEQDVGLQIYALGRRVVFAPHLRVFHDSERRHHDERHIASVTLANVALLIFLRYPFVLWPLGFLQIMRRIFWMTRNGRAAGIPSGLLMIPSHCGSRLPLRETQPADKVWSYLQKKRRLQPNVHGPGLLESHNSAFLISPTREG